MIRIPYLAVGPDKAVEIQDSDLGVVSIPGPTANSHSSERRRYPSREMGDQCIYRSQVSIARWRCPDVVAELEEMLADEVSHRARFAEVMPSRHAKPCRMLFLWGIGRRVLGTGTALLGRNAIWACTAAVEEAVHRHLNDQLAFLSSRDQELYALIDSIKSEELSHLASAEALGHIASA